METLVSQEKNQKIVRTLSYSLIAISIFLLLLKFVFLHGFYSMVNLQLTTRKFIPPLEINYTLYFIQVVIELLLCIVVFISTTFVLKYRNQWRKALVFILIAAVILFMLSPIITYYNIDKIMFREHATSRLVWTYLWSIILSVFFIVAIKRLSKKEVKLLFSYTT